ncbi:hypothetical protein NEHOM01_2427, partial [Nematocida homosporus]|uniref:uncharacterized protein n=1 Tax=Nematocida homosporus TaxID=1912981 RepID=UPI002220EECE
MCVGINQRSKVMLVIGIGCIGLAGWAGYVVYQMRFASTKFSELFGPPEHQQSGKNQPQTCLQPNTIHLEDPSETASEASCKLYYDQGEMASVFASKIIKNAQQSLAAAEGCSRGADYIKDVFVPTMILNPSERYQEEKCQHIISLFGLLNEAIPEDLQLNALFLEPASYDVLWLRVLGCFYRPYLWLCHYLPISNLKELNAKIRFYHQTAANPNDWETCCQNIAKELILSITASINLGGFTNRCRDIHYRLVKYQNDNNISRAPDGTIPIENWIFILDWISYMAPLSLKARSNINKILNYVEIVICRIEQSYINPQTYDVYLTRFSEATQMIIEEINCILELLLSAH